MCVCFRTTSSFSVAWKVLRGRWATGHGRPTRLQKSGRLIVLIADVGSAANVEALIPTFEPLRTVIFTPHERVEVFRAARANGFGHVFRRGALATELPRILSEYAAGASDPNPAV